jgi:type I restriction enzyme S subunit
MNAERLLAHYQKIAEAPDAIARLRRFILDLAVRGKLVPQDPSDEQVAELLKQIAKESAQFRRAGQSARRDVRRPDRVPFELPSGWTWTTVEDVSYVEMGQSPPSEHYNKLGEGIPFFQGKADFGDRSPKPRYWCTLPTKFADPGDILISVRAPVGPTNVADRRCCIGRGLAGLRPYRGFDREFFLLSLRAFEPELASLGFGTTFVAINKNQLRSFPLPFPPLAEQRRIVAKVDELMALCDRLEAARTAREVTRDQLTAATLARLSTADSETFRDDARFALNALRVLTARPDQITQLRQTILNLAVRGKLVPQDPNDEPASLLLRYIERRRDELYSRKKIPRPKKLPPIGETELPDSVPVGWSWSRLGDLCYQVADGPHFSPQYVSSKHGVPFLSTRNVRPQGFDLSSVKYVSRTDHEEFCKRIRPEPNDIIYTKGGTTGIAKVNDLDFEFSVWVHLAVLRIEKEMLCPRYIEIALNSPHCYGQSQQYTQGISNFDLGLTRMIKITVPLPPLAEQHRIVARIDELMALCDRLETSLSAETLTRRRLLDTLLGDALRPLEEQVA